uniref:Late embryogenesis abundant protein LEA-2 subgroup domain-containing protein n=1 Tax=Nelumbo nucifera TaxID=4432 RepID=A0A822Z7J3_NELNU|nr:TPA_asm: hypothetical protein HUJ06_000604 [Nelumbo nucifera]
MQITLSSRNPNDKISIYYDRLDVFVEYSNQQINLPTSTRVTKTSTSGRRSSTDQTCRLHLIWRPRCLKIRTSGRS